MAALLLLASPVRAAIDELAFGESPAAMVYLFVVQEVSQAPDSPFTARRVTNAVQFCKGKISEHLVTRLDSISKLVKTKKYSLAKKAAVDLQAEIYGE